MKLSRSWLEMYSEGLPSTEKIIKTFERIGLEVEEVSTGQNEAIIGRVVSVLKHPDAERLQCCVVDVGDESPRDVVCGASNVREGMLTAYLPVGALLPDGTKISKRKIRGVLSYGMLCSGAEVGLNHSLDGLLVLEEGRVGALLNTIPNLYDPVITLETTPNRPDWLGVYGLARDLHASGIGTLKPLEHGDFSVDMSILTPKIRLSGDACPLLMGRIIHSIDPNAKTPLWMEHHLNSVGIGCIHPVVDITNYVAHSLCRPLHAYDADRIAKDADGSCVIDIRKAKQGEHFQDLTACEHRLTKGMLVVSNGGGQILGLGGIIGGQDSACVKSTTSVFLESAWFKPTSVAQTARALGIDTESRRRFERGVDPQSTEYGCNLATALIVEYCGGCAGELVVAGAPPEEPSPVSFDQTLVKTLTGVAIEPKTIRHTLELLGFRDTKHETYRIPSWRHDIQGAADLVEEVIRIQGIDMCLPVPLPLPQQRKPHKVLAHEIARKACIVLEEQGFCEVRNWSLIDQKDHDYASPQEKGLRLANPMDEHMSMMRYSLFPHLFRGLEMNRNQNNKDPLRFFEIGNIFPSVSNQQTSSLAALAHIPRRQHDKIGDVVVICDMKETLFHLLAQLGYDKSALTLGACSNHTIFDPHMHEASVDASFKAKERRCSSDVFYQGSPDPIARVGKIRSQTLYEYAIAYFDIEARHMIREMRVVGFELMDAIFTENKANLVPS